MDSPLLNLNSAESGTIFQPLGNPPNHSLLPISAFVLMPGTPS